MTASAGTGSPTLVTLAPRLFTLSQAKNAEPLTGAHLRPGDIERLEDARATVLIPARTPILIPHVDGIQPPAQRTEGHADRLADLGGDE